MRKQLTALALVLAAGSAANAQSTPQTPTPATPATTPPVATPQDQVPGAQTTAPGQTPTTPGASQTAPGQTGTTPGQMQTTPGEARDLTPAQTGTTPSGQTVSSANTGTASLAPATAADVKSGVSVYDSQGKLVGKIESVSADGAVLSTGKVRAQIPVSSFAKGDKGLVISMSKAEIDAQSKASTSSKTGKKSK